MTIQGAATPPSAQTRPAAIRPATEESGRLGYDIVIATRNRPQALALTVPLMLAQSRRPERLIVVDASDDHAPVARAIAEAVAASGWQGETIVEHLPPGQASSARQRNLGMRHVGAEVVILPDDDSFFFPGTAAAILQTYEADTEGRIAAVCAAESRVPPEGALPEGGYRMSGAHRREAASRRWRNRLEKRFSQLKPALWLGRLLMGRHAPPAWMRPERHVPVEYMTGFRMSFRSAVIRREGFDEAMGGYALDEDVDASLAAARHGLVVGALEARIYHHRFPGGRGDPFRQGAVTVLNRVYVAHKHIHDAALSAAEADLLRARLRAFIRLKTLLSLAGARRGSGRDQLRGVRAATREARALARAPRGELAGAYLAAQRRLGL